MKSSLPDRKMLNNWLLVLVFNFAVAFYWGFGVRPLAAELREPHSSSSMLVTSLWTITSMKHKQSFFYPVAASISISSSSQWTRQRKWKRRRTKSMNLLLSISLIINPTARGAIIYWEVKLASTKAILGWVIPEKFSCFTPHLIFKVRGIKGFENYSFGFELKCAHLIKIWDRRGFIRSSKKSLKKVVVSSNTKKISSQLGIQHPDLFCPAFSMLVMERASTKPV